LDSDLANNALFADPLLFNTSSLGENNDEAYQIQNSSPAIGNGFLIHGSTDTIDYLQHNGGLDYFGNNVSLTIPSNIGAFNGSGLVHVLNNVKDDVTLYPSVTNNYVNISTNGYSGSIETLIYGLNGQFLGVQKGKKLSFVQYNAGTYFCVVGCGDKYVRMRIVKL
jgi:hypothetical protein